MNTLANRAELDGSVAEHLNTYGFWLATCLADIDGCRLRASAALERDLRRVGYAGGTLLRSCVELPALGYVAAVVDIDWVTRFELRYDTARGYFEAHACSHAGARP